MSRWLVTGGAGFIGSHLVEALLAAGDAVAVLDDLSSGAEQNLPAGARLHHGDVRDAAALAEAGRGCDGVFHLAAIPSVPQSIADPLATHAVCATGTLQVLELARRRGVRVIYAGSSSAYGGADDDDRAPRDESMREAPLSPYAAAKLAGEHYCRVWSRVHRLPTVTTRFFNVFGPRQPADSPYSGVVAAFCRALIDGRRPRIDGDGRQSRDFTFVADVVGGLRRAMAAPLEGHLTVNLATGRSRTVLELLETLCRIAGQPCAPEFGPPRAGDVRHSLAAVDRAREQLGFTAGCDFADGLRQTFDWYRRIPSR